MSTHHLESIAIFVCAAEQGGFSRAADKLKVSKAHVSRQIALLEDKLGAQLFKRSTRKIALTRIGEDFYQRCRGAMDILSDAQQTIIEQQETPRGLIRMTVAGEFGERYVVPAAIAFMQRYQEVQIDIDFTDRLVDLVSEGFDLALRSGILQDSSLIARRIAARKLVTCASPDYLSRYGEPMTLEDLKHHQCLQGSVDHWRFRRQGTHHDWSIESSWRSNNGRALVKAATAGLGITQLPSFYVEDALQKGSLVAVLKQYQAKDNGIWAVYPANRYLPTRVRMFIDALIQYVQD